MVAVGGKKIMGWERAQDTSPVVPASTPDLQRSLSLLGESLARVGAEMDERLRPLWPLCESLSEFGCVSAPAPASSPELQRSLSLLGERLARFGAKMDKYLGPLRLLRESVKAYGASLPPPDSLAADLYRVFAHTRTDQERVAAAKRLLKHFGLKPHDHEVNSLFLVVAEIGHYEVWQGNEALAFVQRRMWNEIRRQRVTEKREFPLEDTAKTTPGRRGLLALEAEMTLAAYVKQAGVRARDAELLLACYQGHAVADAGARLGLKPSAARVALHRTRTKIKKIA